MSTEDNIAKHIIDALLALNDLEEWPNLSMQHRVSGEVKDSFIKHYRLVPEVFLDGYLLHFAGCQVFVYANKKDRDYIHLIKVTDPLGNPISQFHPKFDMSSALLQDSCKALYNMLKVKYVEEMTQTLRQMYNYLNGLKSGSEQ